MSDPSSPTPGTAFRDYMASTGLSQMGTAMQQLLVSWLLVGILLLPADQAGPMQALIGLPAILVMLWGGASADRSDPRSLLLRVYLLAPVLPLFLIAMVQSDLLNLWTIACWGIGMSVVTAMSMPAQQAILNRVAGASVQRGVTIATAIGFLVQILGLMAAGQMDSVGVSAVLGVQAVCLGLAGVVVLRLPSFAPPPGSAQTSAIRNIVEGLRATRNNPVIFQVLLLNFGSSIFNAGAMMTAFPYIVKRVYEGDAWLLAVMHALFFGAAAISNLVMWRFMPFVHPARWFLLMQLTRIVVVGLLWIQPSWPLVVLAVFGWGLNMGITTTMARTVVQESSAPEYRGRVMSVLSLGMVGSAPLGAIALGWVIETFGTIHSLVPAMIVSLGIFIWGVTATPLWSYRSPSPDHDAP